MLGLQNFDARWKDLDLKYTYVYNIPCTYAPYQDTEQHGTPTTTESSG
jgi:hypothetical protein